MKKAIGILLLLSAVNFAQVHAQTYNIRVVDARRFVEPKENHASQHDAATHSASIAQHKHHDVSVYRYPGYYKVNYYQTENDQMTVHGFMITEPGPSYYKAEYKWSGDTLCLNLFNETAKTKVYKGYGMGSSSSLKVDD